MEKKSLVELRKAAFAIGFGFTVGKYAGKLFCSGVDGIAETVCKVFAKKGNGVAQNVCDKAGIIYEEKPDEDETKIKMGFQC